MISTECTLYRARYIKQLYCCQTHVHPGKVSRSLGWLLQEDGELTSEATVQLASPFSVPLIKMQSTV